MTYQDSLNVFASGGVRTPLDVVKSLALGAKVRGYVSTILNQVENGALRQRLSMLSHLLNIRNQL